MDWDQRNVLLTGGCSFIGSHLVDALVERNACVRVVDNLSSGKLENIEEHLDHRRVVFLRGDLLNPEVMRQAVNGMEVVFHVAADHGGRGYVETHQAACATNLALNGSVFRHSREASVKKVLRHTGHTAEIDLRPEMPTGPLNRVANNSLAKKLLGWDPQVAFFDGLRRTIDWYFSTRDQESVAASFEYMLIERVGIRDRGGNWQEFSS